MSLAVDTKNTVASKSIGYLVMEKEWKLIHDLIAGVEEMRKSQTYLPKEPNEDPKAYSNRVKRTPLHEALKDTLEKHAARPFSKPVTLHHPPESGPLADIWGNVDRAGTHGHDFAKEVFEDAEQHGLTHIFVDYPIATGRETLAEERARKLRPTFLNVSAKNLIAWKWRMNEYNEPVLAQIRFKETIVVEDGEWGEVEEKRIRVYNAPTRDAIGTWSIYKQNKDREWVIDASGEHSYPGIPLVTVYFEKTGFMTARPPMRKLAGVNLTHFQSDSDHRNFLRFARIGIIFGKGFSQEQIDDGIEVSPNQAMLIKNEKGSLEYVEVSGESIQAGERDLAKLEERMELLGMQPLVQKTSTNTATSAHINESRHTTIIQTWISSVERGLEECYRVAMTWVNLNRKMATLHEEFSIDIYSDFALGGNANENEFLLNMALAGKMTTKLLLQETKRRGVLAPDVDIDKELKGIKEEFPEPPSLVEGGKGESPSQGLEEKRKATRKKEQEILARQGKGPQGA